MYLDFYKMYVMIYSNLHAEEILLLYYALLEVLDFCDFDLKFDIFRAYMHPNFYKMNVMIYSDLHASRADLELH